MDGENIHLGTRTGNDNFYVFWLNYRNSTIRLAYYDFQRNCSQLLALSGFSSFGLPEILETNGDLQAFVFLGNNSNNVDIFHYELATAVLTPLTETPFSEKNIVLRETNNRIEIETNSLWAQYRYDDFDLRLRKSVLLEKKSFPAKQKKKTGTITPEYYNTYIGFGDSITWGQIRQEQHLESCYLTVLKELLAETYGPSWLINLGNPGENTYYGAQRVDADLDANPAFYFLLMMGVNDVWNKNLFDKDSSLENLAFIIDTALAHNMRVIVSTLTPRKDYENKSIYQYYWDNLNGLSAGILALAKEKDVASIDTLTAFMNTNPPDGWKDLLEKPGWVITDEGKVWAKGNHPNEAGHRLIASLFAPALVSFPPLPPSGISVLNPQDHLKKNVQWDMNYESDFSHFAIEFAFEPSPLSQHLTTVNNQFTFTLFPFLPQLYFRLQTVDSGNRTSAFSAVFPDQTGDYSQAKRRQQQR